MDWLALLFNKGTIGVLALMPQTGHSLTIPSFAVRVSMRGRRKRNGLRFGIQERFRPMEPTNFDHRGPDHSDPSSRVTLPSVSMSTEEVLEALGRYTEESPESDRQTATKLGVKRMTLTAWLGGRDRPQRCMLARLAGFLRRVGYL
jgi:transcriptional regulator with XRE-family HTH domain